MDSSIARLLLLPVESLGAMTLGALRHVGAATWLAIDTLAWLGRGIALRRVRLGVGGIVAQIVRIGG